MKKILLLGATGRTGKWVLESASQKGYAVHCIVRGSNRIPPTQNISVFEGDPQDKSILERAMQGCDAVISVLNIARTSDFPWAPLRTPKQFLSTVMANVIPMAQKFGVGRIVVCSVWGVAETRKDIPFWFRWTIVGRHT